MILQYKGGKNALAGFIIERMPRHKRYCEVFFGGGHVFFQKALAAENVVNDLNGNLINMYRVIHNEIHYQALVLRLRNCVYSRELFEEYLKLYYDKDKWVFLPSIERAFIYLYLNKVSFNGEMLYYAVRPDAGPLYNIESKVRAVHNKFREGNTVIEKLHFRDFISTYDSQGTFFYLDPPYWLTTEGRASWYYEKTMTTTEHEELFELLKKCKGKWLLSYDDVEIIREIYSDFQIMNTPKMFQSSATGIVEKDKQVFKEELLIANFDLSISGTLFEDNESV